MTRFFQMGCTLFTHIQIFANQEAPVADKPLADGTVIQMLRRIPDRRLPSCPKFLFIASFKNDPLPFCGGRDARLGKPNRLSAEFCSTDAAGNAEEEHLPGGQILQQHIYQLFQSQLTAFRDLDGFILYKNKRQINNPENTSSANTEKVSSGYVQDAQSEKLRIVHPDRSYADVIRITSHRCR